MTYVCKLRTDNHFAKSKQIILFSSVIKSSYYCNFTDVNMDELKKGGFV